MKKIIFFDVQFFDRRNHQRFGFKNLRKKKWKLEFWELTKLQNKNIKRNSNFNCNYVKVRKFENFFSTAKYILNLKKGFFFIDHTMGIRYAILARLLYKDCKRITVRERWPNLNLYRLIYIFLTKNPLNLLRAPIIFFKKITQKIFTKLVYPKPVMSINSDESLNERFSFNNHNLDYNNFLKINKKFKNKKISKNIVFIDQGWPLPVDRELRNRKNALTPEIYWSKINLILKNFGKKYKKNVIIAGNTRREINKKLTKHKIIYGKTDELVRKSFLVLTHSSMAVQYAILWKKPLILLDLNAFGAVEKILNILISENIGSKILSLEKYNKKDLYFPKINKKKYKEFENKYIFEKREENKASWDVFSDKLNLYIKENYKSR